VAAWQTGRKRAGDQELLDLHGRGQQCFRAVLRHLQRIRSGLQFFSGGVSTFDQSLQRLGPAGSGRDVGLRDGGEKAEPAHLLTTAIDESGHAEPFRRHDLNRGTLRAGRCGGGRLAKRTATSAPGFMAGVLSGKIAGAQGILIRLIDKMMRAQSGGKGILIAQGESEMAVAAPPLRVLERSGHPAYLKGKDVESIDVVVHSLGPIEPILLTCVGRQRITFYLMTCRRVDERSWNHEAAHLIAQTVRHRMVDGDFT